MAAVTSHFLGIDPKMYRHFAMLTIGLTTVFALFADGETRETMAQNSQRAELKRADESKFGKTKLVDKRGDKPRSNASGGFNGTFGAPMDGGGSVSGNSSYIPPALALKSPPIIIEVDQAALAKMSPEQRKAYLKRLEDERQRRMREGPVVPTPQQVSALAAASAARAGSDSID
ncbi:hypothetical protein GGQ88_002441 [Novosphingobium hassiacum]|uniref:Uncharacterized protein n=1 Tax=Novosphingobium hassiacum TaxID=173676 RepID=A0A7W6EWT3_9SPHN|nr:hypothetical protein [Novosphingobium hassiacum]MBB3861169.1 hypothetical protein [Novosphingobium hassiacum]